MLRNKRLVPAPVIMSTGSENPANLLELREQHPADIADALQRLEIEEAEQILKELPPETAAKSLAELEEDVARELVGNFSPEQLAAWLNHLPANEITDIADYLAPPERRRLISLLDQESRESVRQLSAYDADSAGGIMTDQFLTLNANATIGGSLEAIRKNQDHEHVDITYLYVTNEDGRLVGVVPLREMIFSDPDRSIRDLMIKDVKFVRVDDDQEKIAREFHRYHYIGLPVLDHDNRLVGVVKLDDVLEIAEAEATEDMQLMVGLSGEERALTPWHRAIGKRLPWLYINMATAFLAALVISMFEETIQRWTALAIFLPIIAGQGGNAGMQTLTVIIRDLALGELSPGEGKRALMKEIILGLINGLAVGCVIGVIGMWWQGSPLLGLVALGAMVLNQLAAAVSGVLIPLGLKTLRIDPALASSIFLTTVTDVAGFFFFLGLAYLAVG